LTELGARAVFFDITFPEASSEAVRTRRGRQTFRAVLDESIATARGTASAQSVLRSLPVTAVDAALQESLSDLRATLTSYLPAPDAAVAASLTRARRAGVITGGVVSVLADPPRPAV